MRRTLFLLATLSLATVLPAAAQARNASSGGRGGDYYFRPGAPFKRAVLLGTVDQVLQALPEAYRRLGFAVTPAANRDTMQKDLVTQYMQVRGQLYPGEANSLYFECGRNSVAGSLADNGDITFAMLSRVQQNEQGGTEVLTQVTARVTRRDSSQYPVDCISTGRLEDTLAQFTAQQLQAAEASRRP